MTTQNLPLRDADVRAALATRTVTDGAPLDLINEVVAAVDMAPQRRYRLPVRIHASRSVMVLVGLTLALALAGSLAAGAALLHSGPGGRIAFVGPAVAGNGMVSIDDKGLYVVSPDGGEPAMVTTVMGEVWSTGTDASGNKHYRHSPKAQWSPDGTRLAFREYGEEAGIYVVNADGTGLRRVALSSPDRAAASFESSWQWSPDGTRIAYISPETQTWPPGQAGNGAAYIVDVETEVVSPLVDEPDTSSAAGSIAWSVDGSRIAFGRNYSWHSSIVVVNADGSGFREFDDLGGRSDNSSSDAAYAGALAWSPDGSEIAYEQARFPGTDDGSYVMAVELDTGEVRTLLGRRRLGCCYHGASGGTLRWSPDGSLLGEATSDEGGQPLVALIRSDGSGLRASYQGVSFDWSPDGTRLVVATMTHPMPGWETTSLFIVDRETGDRVWIADGDYPTWSPR